MKRLAFPAVRSSACAACLVAAAIAGCDSSAGHDPSMDGSASRVASGGATGRNPVDGGGASDAGQTVPPGFAVCGGVTCRPGTSSVQSSACCTDANACGLRIVLSMSCLATHEKGGVDSRCAPFELPGQMTLPGCCSPSGCGALAEFDGIGCIPNTVLGRATVACVPDVPFQ